MSEAFTYPLDPPLSAAHSPVEASSRTQHEIIPSSGDGARRGAASFRYSAGAMACARAGAPVYGSLVSGAVRHASEAGPRDLYGKEGSAWRPA